MDFLSDQVDQYADLLISTGVNLQPGQPLQISAELEHAPFVRKIAAKAYDAGASYVQVVWMDALLQRARLKHSRADYLDIYPDFEIQKYRQFVDERWARLSLTGPEYPHAMDDVDAGAMRRAAKSRREGIRFYMDAIMSNRFQWCVAAVPTQAWAAQIYPDLAPDDAVARLWSVILDVCRVNAADPQAAWRTHDKALSRVVDFLHARQIRTLLYEDPTPGPDGKPCTKLSIGMTGQPVWIAASSTTTHGIVFFANMPTEEIFTTPHRLKADGWARTTKPFFPFERRVEDAYFRFEEGKVVEFTAAVGQDVLTSFFEMDGARHLGEVALVDQRSPVNQAGVIFYETLFDENAACHIAFGDAYLEGYAGGDDLDPAEYAGVGINKADVHLDVMLGSPTLNITGVTADGEQVPIMRDGQFVEAALG